MLLTDFYHIFSVEYNFVTLCDFKRKLSEIINNAENKIFIYLQSNK